MKRIIISVALGALLMAGLVWSRADDDSGPPAITALAPVGAVRLFNGQDLDNWVLFVPIPPPAGPSLTRAEAAKFWSVHGEVLDFKGLKGYLRTKASYTNYNLHVEYRWPGAVGATGVIVHVKEPDTVWPFGAQIVAKLGDTGDVVPLGGFAFGGSTATLKKTGKANEQPAGEWNSFDIFCRGDFIAVYSNGELRNQTGKPSATSGQIALQLEGTAIEFRNVWLEGF